MRFLTIVMLSYLSISYAHATGLICSYGNNQIARYAIRDNGKKLVSLCSDNNDPFFREMDIKFKKPSDECMEYQIISGFDDPYFTTEPISRPTLIAITKGTTGREEPYLETIIFDKMTGAYRHTSILVNDDFNDQKGHCEVNKNMK